MEEDSSQILPKSCPKWKTRDESSLKANNQQLSSSDEEEKLSKSDNKLSPGEKEELEELRKLVRKLRERETPTRPTKRRRARLTDSTLKQDGALKKRLSLLEFQDSHLPILPPADLTSKCPAKCQLHRYLIGKEVQKTVAYCKSCNVTLCLYCYKLFHTETNLVWKKDSLKEQFLSDWAIAHKKKDDDVGGDDDGET